MERSCAHCGALLDAPGERFCCPGCEAAHALLTTLGLEQYYELRGPGNGEGALLRAAARAEPWLDEAAERLRSAPTPACTLDLDVQGLHCAACVWVIEQIGGRLPGAVSIEVNPGAGTLQLVAGREFPLGVFHDEVARLGYRLGPRTKGDEGGAGRALLLRLGVCAALTMNVMIFSFALYFGLDSGPLQRLMLGASWALTAAAVVVGGTPFFRSAWASVRAGALHFDLPIALGIALAFAGSTASMLWQQGRASYFDTVASFVTLMLLGRFLQERVLERNRRALLGDEGVEGLLCHRLDGGRGRAARVGELAPGDRLLVRPGELVPVAATLRSPPVVAVSREWITGESEARPAQAGERLEAGCFLVSAEAAVVEVLEPFEASRLAQLLRRPRKTGPDLARRTPAWQALSRGYVVTTLALAAASGIGWALTSSGRALEVVVAVLVVTCPCAFGLAVPVACELAQAALRRDGVFVRSATLLERALGVRAVVFDKTGTLTLGDLELVDPAALSALPDGPRHALAQMAARSGHPRSRAAAAALARQGLDEPLDEACQVREEAGRGLELRSPGGVFRLGARGWAGEGEGDLVLGEQRGEGWRTWLALSTRELPRREAAREAQGLRADGLEVHVLSGDVPARVAALASSLGLDPGHVRGGASPEEKRAYVEALGADRVLMVGDGVNDAAALAAARCSATPAGDMPFVATRTDVYVQGPLVTGIRRLLGSARHLDRVVREAVGFGVAYNVLAVAAACAGLMTPLLAAVLMPLSSLGVVTWVVWRMRPRAPRAVGSTGEGLLRPASVPGVS